MIQQVMIPLAALAITATGVSAFNGDILEKLDIDLSNEQISALEEAHELRIDGAERDEVRAVLEDAGIDRETMQDVRKATHEYREELREKVHTALENGDVTIRTRPDDGVGKGSNSLLGAVKSLLGR